MMTQHETRHVNNPTFYPVTNQKLRGNIACRNAAKLSQMMAKSLFYQDKMHLKILIARFFENYF